MSLKLKDSDRMSSLLQNLEETQTSISHISRAESGANMSMIASSTIEFQMARDEAQTLKNENLSLRRSLEEA